jgi:hypothetical protein
MILVNILLDKCFFTANIFTDMKGEVGAVNLFTAPKSTRKGANAPPYLSATPLILRFPFTGEVPRHGGES